MLAKTASVADEFFPRPARLTHIGGQTAADRTGRPVPRPASPALRSIEGGLVDPSDTTLVARAQAGDGAAFRQLVERHQRRVFQLVLGIVKDREEAMDVVQDTFVKVHQNLPGFKGDAAFTTWTHRIAYNLAIDSVRRTGRVQRVSVDETTLTDEGEQHDPYAVNSPSPQKAALRGELAEEIQRALAHLSENHRSILLLRELDGLSYEELSETLGIPKGTVMSRLFHARQKLQIELGAYLEDDRPALHAVGRGAR